MHIKLVICQEDLLELMGSYTGKFEAIDNAMEINISEYSWQTACNLPYKSPVPTKYFNFNQDKR